MTQSAKGKFFAVDRGAFRAAALGGLNSAVAHLVMARGTAADNRTTRWSVNSIVERTGISRRNTSKAVHDLQMTGVWNVKRDGKHPIYECAQGPNIPALAFTAAELEVLRQLRESAHGSVVVSKAVRSNKVAKLCIGVHPRLFCELYG